MMWSLGDVAQLVEHLLCKQGVGGSSPLVSTLKPADQTSFVLARSVQKAHGSICNGIQDGAQLGEVPPG